MSGRCRGQYLLFIRREGNPRMFCVNVAIDLDAETFPLQLEIHHTVFDNQRNQLMQLIHIDRRFQIFRQVSAPATSSTARSGRADLYGRLSLSFVSVLVAHRWFGSEGHFETPFGKGAARVSGAAFNFSDEKVSAPLKEELRSKAKACTEFNKTIVYSASSVSSFLLARAL